MGEISKAKDTVQNTPNLRNYPLYSQHPNGCGLASLLMLLNVPAEPQIESFLNTIWGRIGKLFIDQKFRQPEHNWASVLQYILLKSLAYSEKEEIYDFFTQRLDYAFEDQRIIHKFNVDADRQKLLDNKKVEEAYTYLHYLEEHDYVLPLLFIRQLHTMKTDMELKLLCELFNYQFDYQESEDSTGAIYFTKEELTEKLKDTTITKWNKLEQAAEDKNKIIFWGRGHHWLAVRGFYHETKLDEEKNNTKNEKKENNKNSKDENWIPASMFIATNDPALVKQTVANFVSLHESDRFYLFKRRPKTDYKILATITRLLKDDTEEESKRWQHYLKQKARQAENANKPDADLKAKDKDSEKDSKKGLNPWE